MYSTIDVLIVLSWVFSAAIVIIGQLIVLISVLIRKILKK